METDGKVVAGSLGGANGSDCLMGQSFLVASPDRSGGGWSGWLHRCEGTNVTLFACKMVKMV